MKKYEDNMKIFRNFCLLFLFLTISLFSYSALAGRWAADTLSNDDAVDFLAEAKAGRTPEVIFSTLRAVLKQGTPDNDEQVARAFAAAELVAAMLGKPAKTLPPVYREWALAHSRDVDINLIDLAIKSIDKLSNDPAVISAMHEQDTRDFEAWQGSVSDLRNRLSKSSDNLRN